jgi:hypothetical protein
MLVTPFYNGQGLGNQLHNYVTVKCLALDKGWKFGVWTPEKFKGTFMKLDMGETVVGGFSSVEGQKPEILPLTIETWYKEETSDYDPFFATIRDNTMVHGSLQGEKYFKHRRDEIKEWLKVEPLNIPEDLCIINFRGGEYKGVRDFFLPKDYWDRGIEIMKFINPEMKFEVHTDDPEEARNFFPDYKVISNMEINWRSIRYAKYLLISNSSFAWLPAWLGDAKLILAPQFWGRRNKGFWFLEQNKTNRFLYI